MTSPAVPYAGPSVEQLAQIPAELKALRQWVLWRGADKIDEKTGDIRLNKIPINPQSLKHADTTAYRSWNTFEYCVAALPPALEEWEQDNPDAYRGGGIGYVFTENDPYTGIDLDHCIDLATGRIADWAQQYVDDLHSYTEVTPSDTGLHVITQGILPPIGRKKGQVEMYSYARFFTMTGNHLPETPDTITANQQALYKVHGRVFGPQALPQPDGTVACYCPTCDALATLTPPGLCPDCQTAPLPPTRAASDTRATPVLADDALLEKARSARNAAKFARLWDGDTSMHNDDDSSADLALCCMLAFWTQDPDQIDRLFRQSALMRKKWNGQRGESTYGARTIAEALARQTTHYTPGKTRQQKQPPPRVDTGAFLKDLASIEDEDSRYVAVLEALDTLTGLDRRAWMTLKRQIKKLVPTMNMAELDTARAEVKRQADDDDRLTTALDADDMDGLAATARADDADDDLHPERRYRETSEGIVWAKPTKEGPVDVLLANFVARITASVIEDDGVETRSRYEITAFWHGVPKRALVPAHQFAAMGWIAEYLGPRAIIMAGMTLRDHLRASIQLLSHDIATAHVYTHIGWRQLGEDWIYLYAGGAIGAEGPVPEVTVAPGGALENYALTLPTDHSGAQAALLASMQMLTVAPPDVTIPLYGAIWRAVLGTATLSLHLTGETGKGKTELAALVQQHWGSRMHAKRLPAAWSATANALETMAFQAKDSVLVIDDFCPRGSPGEVAQLHGKADRVLRAQGNLSARGRLDRNGRERPLKPPRGLIVSTGEDIPMGQSVRARVCILEVTPETVNWNALTPCQTDATNGLYSQAMAAFVQWLAPHYDTVLETLPQELIALRGAAVQTAHRRTPELVAHLALGWRYFLACAHALGVLTEAECQKLWGYAWTTLGDVALAQQDHQGDEDPVRRFLALLSAAVTGGLAHVQDGETLGPPADPQDWGWTARETTRSTTTSEGATLQETTTTTTTFQEWTPHGTCIGWRAGERLYLEPETSYSVVQRLAETQRAPLALTKRTLHKRMHEQGMLLRQPSQQQNTVKRSIGPSKTGRHVLDISVALLSSRNSIFSISSIEGHIPQQNSQIPQYCFPEWTAKNQYSAHRNQYSNQYSTEERQYSTEERMADCPDSSTDFQHSSTDLKNESVRKMAPQLIEKKGQLLKILKILFSTDRDSPRDVQAIHPSSPDHRPPSTGSEKNAAHRAPDTTPCALCDGVERWNDHGTMRCVACYPPKEA